MMALKGLGRFWSFLDYRQLSSSSGDAAPSIPALLVFFCIGGAFVLRPAPVWALTFYVGVAPMIVYRLWHGRLERWQNVNLILIGSLVLWSTATLLWGENPGGGRVL